MDICCEIKMGHHVARPAIVSSAPKALLASLRWRAAPWETR